MCGGPVLPPLYPAEAKQQGIEGAVRLKAVIGADGSVKEVRVLDGHPLLAPAAVEAVKRWKYKPYYVDDKPVEVETTITVNFTLQKGDDSDHLRLSTPVVQAWRNLAVGSPVYALDDAAIKGWLDRALIQRITVQTGIWHIWIERGYSVFRIYPYLSNVNAQRSAYQGIVLKVNGSLSVEDLTEAIRKRTPTVRIDEYEVFGADGGSFQKYSRPHKSGRVTD